MARWVVRTYLEIERGHRDVRTLRPVLAPHLYFALQNAERRPGSPPVASRDVGGAQFNRIGHGKGFAAVVVRDADGLWDAIMLTFRRTEGGAWRVIDIQRVRDVRIPESAPARPSTDEG